MGVVVVAGVVVVVLLVLLVLRRRGTEGGDLTIDDVGREVSDASDRHRPERDHLSGPGNYGF